MRTTCVLFALASACTPDFTLEPPQQGFQLRFGPFDVPAVGTKLADGSISNGETQMCRTMKLPNDQPIAIDRLQVKMNTGSHHFILFRGRQQPAGTPPIDYPDQVFPCFQTVNFDEWDFVLDVNDRGGNGSGWQLAGDQAFVFEPHAQVMLQSHFVNATSFKSPQGGMALLNLFESKTPAAAITKALHGMFTVNTRVDIPPNIVTTTGKNCTLSKRVAIVAMTGHYHARGQLFTVDMMQKTPVTHETILGREIYRSTNPDQMLFETFDPPVEVGGAKDGVYFECAYLNDPTITGITSHIGFGGHADVQEHCNLFFQYYDIVDAPPLACAEGPGGW